jgi:hypothetical protein
MLECLRDHLRELAQAGLIAISFGDSDAPTNDTTLAAMRD